MSVEWPWSVLGLDGSAQTRDIKRAYAKCLKTIDRTDPDAFQSLLRARDVALEQAVDFEEITPEENARPSIRSILDGAQSTQNLEEDEYPNQEPVEQKQQPLVSSDQTASQDNLRHEVLKAQENAQNPKDIRRSRLEPRDIEEDVGEVFESSQIFEPQATRAPSDTILLAELDQLLEEKDYSKIEHLWQHPDFQIRLVRLQVERRLADEIAQLVKTKAGIPKELAQIIEDEFNWVADSVGAQHRTEQRDGSELFSVDFANVLSDDSRESIALGLWFAFFSFLGLPALALYVSIVGFLDGEISGSFIFYFIVQLLLMIMMLILCITIIIGIGFILKFIGMLGFTAIAKFAFRRMPKHWQNWIRARAMDRDEAYVRLGFVLLWSIQIDKYFF